MRADAVVAEVFAKNLAHWRTVWACRQFVSRPRAARRKSVIQVSCAAGIGWHSGTVADMMHIHPANVITVDSNSQAS